MGLEIHTLDKEEPVGKITATKDLYLTADGETVVTHGDDAAFLLVREGREVPVEYEDRVTKGGNPKKGRKGAEDKQAKTGGDK